MSMQPCWNLVFATAAAVALSPPVHAQAADNLSAADRVAVFKAAGAVQQGGRWVICAEDPTRPEAVIEELRDLNGDGRPEALVTEGGTFCNGASEAMFALVGKQVDGSWRNMLQSEGVAEFLQTKGKDGWPDVSIGGPGFCFPVLRWNGNEYDFNRNEYAGKPCKA